MGSTWRQYEGSAEHLDVRNTGALGACLSAALTGVYHRCCFLVRETPSQATIDTAGLTLLKALVVLAKQP